MRVRFERKRRRDFDLVIGADGLHSQVRQLVFGEVSRFERHLGLKVAASAIGGYRPRDDLAYVVHTEGGQQVARFSVKDDRTVFLFVVADPEPAIPDELAGPVEARARGAGRGGGLLRVRARVRDRIELPDYSA